MKKIMIRNVIETGKERKKLTVTETGIGKGRKTEAARRTDIEIVIGRRIEIATAKGTALKNGAVTDIGTVIETETEKETERETGTETGNIERGPGMFN